MKRKLLFSLILTAILFITANVCAESVTKMHYVFLDWSGEYTGQVDTNNIPFGFGLFESEKPLEGELWHYLGSWDSGLPDGEGAVYFENGNMQKGTFSKGELADGLKYTVSGLAVVPVTAEISSADEIEAAYIGNKKSLRHYQRVIKNGGILNQSPEARPLYFFEDFFAGFFSDSSGLT